jgi:hypothetical protein
MSRDPVDRNMLRMELRRFQTRCDALEGTIRRADSLRQVARLGNVVIPFLLAEETGALDARGQVRHTAEERARELINELLKHFEKVEPYARDKVRYQIEDELLNLVGPLNALRNWAQGRLTMVEQALRSGQ